jgi:FMN reductase
LLNGEKPSDDSLLPQQLFKKELIMSRPLKVVAVSGGTWRPSRTLVLTQALLANWPSNCRSRAS